MDPILIGIGLSGLILLLVSGPLGHFAATYISIIPWSEVLTALGIALIISAILGFTVDSRIKARLTSELKEDVFRAAMGYLFPEEIRDEVRWFYNFPVVAERRSYHISIKHIEGNEFADFVEVTTSDNVTIKNISNKKADVGVEIIADEWGIKGKPTQLIELGYEIKGKRIESGETPPKEKLRSNDSIEWSYGKVTLKPGDRINIWRKLKETKRISDNVWWVSVWPTTNPEIRIDCSPDLQAQVTYVGRDLEPEGRNPLEKFEEGRQSD
jgi:hypothetical protein